MRPQRALKGIRQLINVVFEEKKSVHTFVLSSLLGVNGNVVISACVDWCVLR